MDNQRTLIIVKPDGVKRALVGEVMQRFEKMGLKIVAMKMLLAPKDILTRHYNSDKPSTWERIGGKTKTTFEKYGKDLVETYGTDDISTIGKLIIDSTVEFMASSPCIPVVLEGRHAIENVVNLVGPTMPVNAPAGTIRGDFSNDSAAYANAEKRPVFNIVHASANEEEAAQEIALWFRPEEIFDYKRLDELL